MPSDTHVLLPTWLHRLTWLQVSQYLYLQTCTCFCAPGCTGSPGFRSVDIYTFRHACASVHLAAQAHLAPDQSIFIPSDIHVLLRTWLHRLTWLQVSQYLYLQIYTCFCAPGCTSSPGSRSVNIYTFRSAHASTYLAAQAHLASDQSIFMPSDSHVLLCAWPLRLVNMYVFGRALRFKFWKMR